MWISNLNTVPTIANLPGQGQGGPAPGPPPPPPGPTVDLVENKYSFQFDGSAGSYFRCTNTTTSFLNSLSNSSPKFSISLWANMALPNSVNSTFIGTGTGNNGPITFESAAGPRLIIKDAAGDSTTIEHTGTTFTNDTWYHFGCIYDATPEAGQDVVKLYINGLPVATQVVGGGSVPTTFLPPSNVSYSNDLAIGASRVTPAVTGGDKYLDEVALWNIALDNASMELIYNSTINNTGQTAKLSTLSTGAPYAWFRMGD